MITSFALLAGMGLGYGFYLWNPFERASIKNTSNSGLSNQRSEHPLSLFWARLTRPFRIQRMRVAMPAGMGILSGVVRAGGSLVQGLEVLAREGPEPLKTEIARILSENLAGRDLDRSLASLALRYPFPEMELAAAGIRLSRQTGSDMGDVLDRVVVLARNELELSQKVRALSAQGIMSAWVMALLPVGMFFLLGIVDQFYMRPLFENPVGKNLLILCLGWEAIGILWIFQIIRGVGR